MFRQAKTYSIKELTPEVVRTYYPLMESIKELYTMSSTPEGRVLVVVMKTADRGLSVDISTTGKSREFDELCNIYEDIFTIFGQKA